MSNFSVLLERTAAQAVGYQLRRLEEALGMPLFLHGAQVLGVTMTGPEHGCSL
jgi:hypothetical protein